MLYKKKLDIQKKSGSKEAPLNLFTSLSGVSWRQVEHLVDKVADAEDGFAQVLDQLDRCFKYDDRVEMPRALEKFFYGATRRGDQSLMQYCADHGEARRELEKHKISLLDSVSGWLLLRRSSLTYKQRQMVQTHCTSLEETKVEESLYYLFGHDYRGRSDVRWGANTTPAKLHQRWPRRHQAYTAEEVYELEEDEAYDEDFDPDYADAEETYYEDMPEGDYSSTWDGHHAEEMDEAYHQTEDTGDMDSALEEGYAAYLDARRQFSNLRGPRVFSSCGPGSRLKRLTTARLSQLGPKGKGKAKGSSSKGRGKNANPPRKGSPASRHRPTLEVQPTVSFVAKLDILLRNVPAVHQSRKEHLPALPQTGSRQLTR